MFLDRVKIHVKGGNGGNGHVSFRREKYVTNGGPDGGDGGKGGSIIFVASEDLNNLGNFRYTKKFVAQNGENGMKKKCSGKNGEDLIIKVPVGTVIKEAKSGKIMADLTFDKQEKILIAGGKGGRGNQHFATARMQAPKYAQKGIIAKEYNIILELKLIADIGIIGFPNVGKSTLLSMITNANPKIDNYHFTTLSPNLGVLKNSFGSEVILADIPGLIEGASEKKGLGHNFLRHIERTKILLHVVDVSGVEGTDPIESIDIINNELAKFNEKLSERPQIIAANKMDITGADENFKVLKTEMEKRGIKVVPISAATKQGLNELVDEVINTVKSYPDVVVFPEDYEEYEEIEIEKETFSIEIIDEAYEVTGVGIEKMLSFTNLDTERGFAFFQRYMRENGIIDKLIEMGIQEGDTVRMYFLEFDYY